MAPTARAYSCWSEGAEALDTSELQPFEGADVKWQKMITERDQAEAKALAAEQRADHREERAPDHVEDGERALRDRALVRLEDELGERLPFVLLAFATVGLLHVQICSSHFSRETFSGPPGRGKSWFELQLDGTLDLDCWERNDWFHGGLQFQIEHHLFPRMPRRNLRKIKPLVQAFAKKHNVPYVEMSFVEACRQIVVVLKKTALDAKKTDVSFFQSEVWEGMNLVG